jgi:glycosyltransferase involved in cell wall biosynthesis
MKIAMIAPPIERVPPRKYGGTERFVHALTEELVRRGHDVTLFASGDSITDAILVPVYPHSLREAEDLHELHVQGYVVKNLFNAYKRWYEFDIIHDNTLIYGLPVASLIPTPTVITVHNHFDERLQDIFRDFRKPFYIAISHSQRFLAPDIRFSRVIHHGLDMDNYPFSAEHDGYLLYVGRITREKGVHHAIAVAQKLNLPLIIAAKVDRFLQADIIYFNEEIKPHLNDKIRWIGEVDEEERNKLMSRAMCYVHPVTWPEPFGLALIEALACGCPVIGFNKGSIPEIVQHSRSGFVVETEDEMADAVQKIDAISREYCRDYARAQFSVKRMADEYEALYQNILQSHTYTDVIGSANTESAT